MSKNFMDNWFFSGGIKFESAEELMDLSGTMDTAIKTPIFTRDYLDGGKEMMLDKWDGVMNINTKEVCAIASDNYEILQHGDCINDLASGIIKSGHDVAGALLNYRDSFVVRYILQDVDPIDDGAKGIHIGCEVRNSYNKSSSFRGRGFLVRQVCSNGMVMKTLLGDVDFSVYHTARAQQRKTEAISNYIESTISSIQKNLGVVIERAKDSELIFDSVENLQGSLADFFGVAIHAQNIVDNNWDGRLNTTRWDLYNAATEYISHTEMSPAVQERLIVKSEMLLDEKTPVVICV